LSPFDLHALHISSFFTIILIMTGKEYSYEDPHTAAFSNLLFLHPNILNTLISNILICLCSSLNVSRPSLQPYRTTRKIIILHTVMFIFLDCIQVDKQGSELNGSRCY
jgi:hypothetical protein